MIPTLLSFHYAGHSDIGRHRDHNEDTYGLPNMLGVSPAQTASQGTLLVVADGMGGRAAGEEASALAVRTLFNRYYADPQPDRRAAMSAALAAANTAVKLAGEDDLNKAGMGSTLAAMVAAGDKAFVAHAGDSRVYRLRGGKLERLTNDHTWVAESVAAGVITEAEAANHPYRHSLTRALGLETTLNPTLSDWFPLAAGDRYLLCSDGLTNELREADLARWLRESSPDQAAAQLVEQARRAGGRDNITAVTAAVGGDGGAIVPSAAKAAGSNGRRNWPLLLAGGVIGLVTFIGVLIGLNELVRPPIPTATPVVQAIIETATPTAINTRPPTSTIAATSTPAPTDTPTATPTDTLTPTPTATHTSTATPTPTITPSPSPTSTPTPVKWVVLRDSEIIGLDPGTIESLREQNLCSSVSDSACTLTSDVFGLSLEGVVVDSELQPELEGHEVLLQKAWNLDNVDIVGDFADQRVRVIWRYDDSRKDWVALLFTPLEGVSPQERCLANGQRPDFNFICVKNGIPPAATWRARLYPQDVSAERPPLVLLEAGTWNWKRDDAVYEFDPLTNLRFEMDPSLETVYRPAN